MAGKTRHEEGINDIMLLRYLHGYGATRTRTIRVPRQGQKGLEHRLNGVKVADETAKGEERKERQAERSDEKGQIIVLDISPGRELIFGTHFKR